jgi:hypothetical protein
MTYFLLGLTFGFVLGWVSFPVIVALARYTIDD